MAMSRYSNEGKLPLQSFSAYHKHPTQQQKLQLKQLLVVRSVCVQLLVARTPARDCSRGGNVSMHTPPIPHLERVRNVHTA